MKQRNRTRLVLQSAILFIACTGLGIADSTAFAAEAAGAASPASELAWSIVPSPRKAGSSSHLYAISALSPTQAWAVGDRSVDEGAPLIYRWDGRRWRESAPAPVPDSYLHDVVAISSNDVWTVGHQDRDDFMPDLSLTEHWDGVSWSIVPSPNPSQDRFYGENYLAGVAAVASDDVWAVGYQQTDRGYSELIIHWNGVEWTLIDPLPGSYRVLTDVVKLSASDIWAVGYSFTFGAGYQGLFMHWDGTKWSNVAGPRGDKGFYLHGVTALSPSDIWAVGDGGGYPVLPVTLHWDGTAWSFVDISNFTPEFGSLKAVTGLGTDDVWAVGYYRETLGGKDESLLEHWDGVAWSKVEIPNVARALNQLYDLAPDRAGGLWTVGYFYPTDFVKPISTLILRGIP